MARIRVKSGRLVDPFNLNVYDIAATDFPHSLAQVNRFTGQCRWPYPVGQHCIVLHKHVPKELKRAALMHDDAEVYFNDLASPVKAEYPEYKEDEKRALWIIAQYHSVSWEELEAVSRYDKRLYADERNALFDNIEERGMGDENVALGVDPWFFRERYWQDNVCEMYRLRQEYKLL
jgi:hypothetical protein